MESLLALITLIVALVILSKTFIRKTFVGGLIGFIFDLLLGILTPFLKPLTERIKNWFKGENSGIHGTSRFLNEKEKKELLSPNHKGFTINGSFEDKISLDNSRKHGLVLAPSGYGKTTSLVIPGIQQAEESLIINDPDGSIYKATGGLLASKGYDLKILNLANPRMSHYYNPIAYVNSPTEIARLADVLISSSLKSNGKDSFWNESAKKLLDLLIKGLKTQDEKYHNLANLSALLDQFGTDGIPLIDLMLYTDKQTQLQFKGLLSAKEEVLQDIVMTARVALKFVNNQEIAELTSKETLNFKTLRKRKTALFIIDKETSWEPMMKSLLFSDLFNFLMETPSEEDLDVKIFADEAGNFKIVSLPKLITVLRRRRVSVQLIIQDTFQLNSMYGDADSRIIMSNCFTKIFFPGLSYETCRNISDSLGMTTQRYVNPHAADEEGKNEPREMARKLITADELYSMQNCVLVLIGNNRPYLTQIYPYYENPVMKEMSEIEAPELPYNEVSEPELIDLEEMKIEI